MTDPVLTVTAVSHVLYRMLWSNTAAAREREPTRDRGAISLEQVLWFVAAGVSVAVIAAIIWNQIRDQANTPVETPSAP